MKKLLIAALLVSVFVLGCVGSYVVVVKGFKVTGISSDLKTAYANVTLLVVAKSPVPVELQSITFNLYCIDKLNNSTKVLIGTGNYSTPTPLNETELKVPMEVDVRATVTSLVKNFVYYGNATLMISGDITVKEAGIPTTVHFEHTNVIEPDVSPLFPYI